jgi:ADP-heptose:LPS heptosyltransferase
LRLERDHVELVEGVRKLAVLRANAIGDYLVSLPAIEALGAAYPAAELVLLGSGWHAGFLAGRPGPVDRCVPVPPTVGVRDDRPPSPPATAAACRPNASTWPCSCRAGAATPTRSWAGSRRGRLQVTPADRAEAAAALAEDDRPLVVLHPGANDPRRRWPVERLAVVGSELAGKGARLAVVGTASERGLVDRLLDGLDGDAADLAGRLGLGGLAGLLEQAALLVGNDSGPRHLAAAVGTATVAIHWGVSLGSYGPLYRARHRAPTAWRLHCPVCGANGLQEDCRTRHEASLVTDGTVDEVLAEAHDLLTTETARESTR